jgi:rhomboid protease GluP
MFSLLSPSPNALFAVGASGAVPVFGFGRWWTVLSASWLHGSLLHLLFNMLWVRDLGPSTAELYGASRMVIIYTVAGVVGFLLSSAAGAFFPLPFLGGAQLTVGASASIFGLLAALVHYGRRAGSSHIGSQAWGYAVVLFVLGFVMRGVDNWAHLGGFLGGYLAARLLDPLREERTDHTLAAIVCLAASFLAVGASFFLRPQP